MSENLLIWMICFSVSGYLVNSTFFGYLIVQNQIIFIDPVKVNFSWTMETIRRIIQSWELLCWILRIQIAWSWYPPWALSIQGSMHNLFIIVIPPGHYYLAGYWKKVKLICRLTRDQDQALISTSTIQKFSPQVGNYKICYGENVLLF